MTISDPSAMVSAAASPEGTKIMSETLAQKTGHVNWSKTKQGSREVLWSKKEIKTRKAMH